MAATGSATTETLFHQASVGHRCRPPMPVMAACDRPISDTASAYQTKATSRSQTPRDRGDQDRQGRQAEVDAQDQRGALLLPQQFALADEDQRGAEAEGVLDLQEELLRLPGARASGSTGWRCGTGQPATGTESPATRSIQRPWPSAMYSVTRSTAG